MLVRHAMTRGAETIAADETLQAAAIAMRSHGVGALPVRAGDTDDRIVGMITDRDIVTRATAEGVDPRSAPVRAAMTPQIVTCFEHEPLEAAARLMEGKCVRRLVVLNAEGDLVGLLSADDLALVARGLAADVLERTRDPERMLRSWSGAQP